MGKDKLPLVGIRVCDFTWAVVGPMATQMFAVMGAEVIKVESGVHTDINRRVAPYMNGEEDIEKAGSFHRVNLSKNSCTLDMTKPEAVEIAKKIIAISDVVISNFRNGVMDRFGLDSDTLKALNPDLILVSSTSMGNTGPQKDYVGYNEEAYAYGGLGNLTGYEDEPPSMIAGDYADYLAGTLETFATLSALHYRNSTGKGQSVEVSMVEAAACHIPEEIMDYAMNRQVRRRIGNRMQGIAPHNCFRCKGEDHWVAIAATSDVEWHALRGAIGSPEWSDDERFMTSKGRFENQDELEEHIEAWTRNYTTEEVTKTLQGAGVPAGPSLTIKELVEDPHLNERGYFVTPEHPVVGEAILEGMPWKSSKSQPDIRHAPMMGQDNYYVLSDLLDMPDEEIARLMAEGVVN